MTTKKIMFICVGNSFRSQIAEGFVRAYGGLDVEAFSAGPEPCGFVHPGAIAVMREKGIDISEQQSKPIDPQLLQQMDLVVTVCEPTQKCPVIPKTVPHRHIPVQDPVGSRVGEEKMEVYRRVRDELEKIVTQLLRGF